MSGHKVFHNIHMMKPKEGTIKIHIFQLLTSVIPTAKLLSVWQSSLIQYLYWFLYFDICISKTVRTDFYFYYLNEITFKITFTFYFRL